MLRARRWRFGNFAGHVKGVSDAISLLAWIAGQFDPSVTWDDIAWIRRLWPGKLVLKGIMDAEDAKRAIETGADAIVVSNHGGRQLDGAPSSIYALPRIAQAVGSRTEIWFDGGIRSGQDILKALALGAKGTMIGRAFVYGLGTMGETGVRLCLDILANELSATMALCGVTKISQVDSSVLVTPPRVQILSPDEVLPRREAGHTISLTSGINFVLALCYANKSDFSALAPDHIYDAREIGASRAHCIVKRKELRCRGSKRCWNTGFGRCLLREL